MEPVSLRISHALSEKKKNYLKTFLKGKWTRNLAVWWSACPASVRPWIHPLSHFPVLQKRVKQDQKHSGNIFSWSWETKHKYSGKSFLCFHPSPVPEEKSESNHRVHFPARQAEETWPAHWALETLSYISVPRY